MLTRLTVQHYKSLENVDIELGPLTVFVGRNGSGKSNIIDAIRFVRDAVRDGLDDAVTLRHGFGALQQWSNGCARDISLGIHYEGAVREGYSSGRFFFSLRQKEDGYEVHREVDSYRHAYGGDVDFSISSVRRGNRFIILSPERPCERDVVYVSPHELLMSLPRGEATGFMFNFADSEFYSIFPNTLREPQKISHSDDLSPHGGNLASILRRMTLRRDRAELNEIEDLMRSILPRLERITVDSLGGYIVPRFLMREESGEEHFFDVNHLSDGTLRILGILTALYHDPGPRTIALEEPELTIHPGALPLLADAMKEAAKRRQVIITTHSPDLIDQFDPKDVRIVEMDGRGVTSVAPLSQDQMQSVKEHLFTLGQLMSIEGLRS
ncbi:AAA family ATPase [Novispirillum sp. DQ9]|uniref:AAA family ATPase n=1 Tax=Novispirillum sp. DQ9 TaxID=3398612 RepID=UPI003C7ECEEB